MPDELPRRLPGTALTDAQRIRLPVRDQLPSTDQPSPRTVPQLRAEGLVGRGDEHFNVRERAVAEWLRDRDVTVVSVAKSTVEGHRTPDALVNAVTAEFKTLDRPTRNAVVQALREARGQSRRIVVDGRTVGLSDDDMLDGLAEALRKFGGDVDEVTFILSDGLGLRW